MREFIVVFILVFAAVGVATLIAPPFGKWALSDS